MSGKSPYPSVPNVKRMIAAAKAAGLDVAGIEVSPDGMIRIIEARALPAKGDDLFDQWKDRV